MTRWSIGTWWLLGTAIVVGHLLPGCGVQPAETEPTPTGTARYLGQPPPGEVPALFAPGVVSTDAAIELNGVVSPDGHELFFTRVIDDVFVMHQRRLGEDGRWSDPEPVYTYPDRAPGLAVDMAHSPDGDRLYFLGRYSDELGAQETNSDLFVIERQGDGWSLASPLPAPVNTPEYRESYPSVVADGSLYFSSDRPGGHGKTDIWRAQRRADGSFDEPVNLGPPINTAYSEGDTYVAPDESWLIVTSRRPGGPGGGDLFVAFRNDEGSWTDPQPLPPPINSELLDYCPMGTPDGRALFFSRRTCDTWDDADAGDVWWIDAAVIERLRP